MSESDHATDPSPGPAPFVPMPPPDFDANYSKALVRRSPFDQARELVAYLADIDTIANELCKSTLLPRNMQAPANLKLVLLQGLEMGFSVVQAIRASYVIESKEAPPRVGYYVEALVALVRKSPVCRFFRVEECTPKLCRVVCARKDEDESVIHTFELSMEQAQAGNLDKRWDPERKEFAVKFPWKASPSDMLRNRCCGRAVKTVFQDVVFGMSTPDELDDLASADAMERASGGGFAPAPSSPRAAAVAPTGEAPRPGAVDIVEADIVGSGDAAWDELLEILGPLAGVDTEGWMPPDLCEEWDRRIAGADTKVALNAFGPWIGEVSKRAKNSRACTEVAAHMTKSFNDRSGEIAKRERAAAAAAREAGKGAPP